MRPYKENKRKQILAGLLWRHGAQDLNLQEKGRASPAEDFAVCQEKCEKFYKFF
jgi:hypothetical protein